MGNPVVHFEVRAKDPDAARAFYGQLFAWTFPTAAEPGYTYVETSVPGAIAGGIGKAPVGNGQVTFFVGVDNVEAALAKAVSLGGSIVMPATKVPGVTFGLFADPDGHIVGVSTNE